MVKSDVQRDCDVLSVDEDAQVATVRLTLDNQTVTVGVNLWEVKGYKRKWDGLSIDRFLPRPTP